MEVVSSEPAHIEDSVVSTISASIDTSASQISALCDEIEQIADHIVKKRKRESNKDSRSFSAHHNILQTATGTFVRLRLLNRKLHEDKAALAQNVNDMKQLTDDLALLLENKAREVAYIQKEIDSTEKLETIYQTINIIPLDSFLEEAPEEYKQNTNTPHEMMLSRLRYEIKQREM
ncbi:hypothetical protein BX661DRAFT_179203 [Kickxella alabastrina]|uniref:uncharacterized protein n=1 Tax=Kickxella alabastrina TaxID=61397 RepID=UPI00221F2AE5|nr:uncharacterized protein BX661DRAFT_179203 [Kickxella alabastrina]KAI7833118.1 hypothetical protein BX661DRAFT_179203 [Kickxella alabastrina]KAJ1932553.1 THO complex subunit 5 [Kickxella alabastrina]